jgi:type II secretory pathway component PulF
LFPLRYDQIANFAGNLSTCLAAGVEWRKAIRTSSGALVNATPEFRGVWDRIDQGEPLSDALRVIERRLPPFVMPVVRCGERTGRLDEALHFLAEHCRMLHRPSTAVRNAWLLPLAIYFGGKALGLILLFLFGSWSSMLSAAMDLLTSCGSLAAIVILYLATPIKTLIDQVKVLLPVIGTVERELALNRFLHVFSMLIATGGERVEDMIRHAAQTIDNDVLRADLIRAAGQVERGATLAEAFDKTTTLSTDEKSELAAGDLAGRLAETCARIAQRAGESAATKLVWITHVTTRLTMGLAAFSLAASILPLLLLRGLSG